MKRLDDLLTVVAVILLIVFGITVLNGLSVEAQSGAPTRTITHKVEVP